MKQKSGERLEQIIQIIVERLEKKGMDLNKIPACIEAIFNIISLYSVSSCWELNEKMQTLGWPDFTIDDHTFKLIKLVYSKSETVPVLR